MLLSQNTTLFHRFFIAGILFLVFVMSFVFVPYWKLADTAAQRMALLSVTTLFGGLWAYLSSESLAVSPFQPKRFRWLLFLILLGFISIVNFRAMSSVIPWRGDEDFHILSTINASIFIFETNRHLLLPVFLASLLFLFLAWKKSWLAVCAAIGLIVMVSFLIEFTANNRFLFLRYQFSSRWIYAVINYLVWQLGYGYHEIAYRIVPLMCTAIIAWYFAGRLKEIHFGVSVLWGMAISTIPVLVYYSSILYLEMPAVVLMAVVCMDDTLLSAPFERLKKNQVWYALLLIGFIKDNTLPFIGCFILCRFLVLCQGSRNKKTLIALLDEEIKVCFCLLYPLALFLWYRWYFLKTGYTFIELQLLKEMDVYLALLRSFPIQIGIISFFLLPATVILFREKAHARLLLAYVIIILISLFHMIFATNYTGYSRYTLLLVPAFLAAVTHAFTFLKSRHFVIVVSIIICIASNLLLSPLNADGTKKPYWGNDLLDTSEHYYPYKEAIGWLKNHHFADKILLCKNSYPYYSLHFYFQKFKWQPQYAVNSSANMHNICRQAEIENVDVIVYQGFQQDLPPPVGICNYPLEKEIKNMAYSIFIYKKS
jgi:hypothetical protein